jgi:hypothetical protein
MQTYYNKVLSYVKIEFAIKSKGSYPTTSLFVSSFNGCQTSKLDFISNKVEKWLKKKSPKKYLLRLNYIKKWKPGKCQSFDIWFMRKTADKSYLNNIYQWLSIWTNFYWTFFWHII